MTREQAKRYAELEKVKFKTYIVCDEIVEIKKDVKKFSDLLMLKWAIEETESIPTSVSWEFVKKILGSMMKVNEFMDEAKKSGFIKDYEYRRYGRDFSGYELTKKGVELLRKKYPIT